MRNEGWFDPWSLLLAFRRKAVAMGVTYLHGEVVGVGVDGERVTGVEVCVCVCVKLPTTADYHLPSCRLFYQLGNSKPSAAITLSIPEAPGLLNWPC